MEKGIKTDRDLKRMVWALTMRQYRYKKAKKEGREIKPRIKARKYKEDIILIGVKNE